LRDVALPISAIGWLLFGPGTADAAVRTPKKPVVNEYRGVKVADDFQWLENADDPAVRRWTDLQNQHSRATLDKLPARPIGSHQTGRVAYFSARGPSFLHAGLCFMCSNGLGERRV
jgi:hypothetical protein